MSGPIQDVVEEDAADLQFPKGKVYSAIKRKKKHFMPKYLSNINITKYHILKRRALL